MVDLYTTAVMDIRFSWRFGIVHGYCEKCDVLIALDDKNITEEYTKYYSYHIYLKCPHCGEQELIKEIQL